MDASDGWISCIVPKVADFACIAVEDLGMDVENVAVGEGDGQPKELASDVEGKEAGEPVDATAVDEHPQTVAADTDAMDAAVAEMASETSSIDPCILAKRLYPMTEVADQDAAAAVAAAVAAAAVGAHALERDLGCSYPLGGIMKMEDVVELRFERGGEC
ncbi:hypothetical protein HDU97_003320 [Phlyctochytrium planicorne]|nr:hypothetical protein HDU97_003320 [Phlyctochytrium planicorne]